MSSSDQNSSIASETGQKYGELDRKLNIFDPECAYKLAIDRWLWQNSTNELPKLEKSFIYYVDFINGYLKNNSKTGLAKTYKIPKYELLVIDHFLFLNTIHKNKKLNDLFIYYNAFLKRNLQKLRYVDSHGLLTTKALMLISTISRNGFNGFNIKCLSENYGLFNEISLFLEKMKNENFNK